MSEKKSTTLRHIAQVTGLSLGTVSQALNNKNGVAPETRQRVLDVATELNYQPSRIGSEKPLETIGIMVKLDTWGGPIALNPFYSQVLTGVERECNERNISLLYTNVEVDTAARPVNWPPRILDQDLDGLIIVGAFLQESFEYTAHHIKKPIVLVDASTPNPDFDSIEIDNIKGAATAVSYLIEQGHQHIGLIGSSSDAHPSIHDRTVGYYRALQQHGITQTYVYETPLVRQAAQQAAHELIHQSPQITAIFACNDDVAIGVLNAARELGRRVPDDLSIIGFDNIATAQETTPPLTTMHVDKLFMGALAVRQLADRTENPDRPGITTSIRTSLIIRESVRSRLVD